MRYKMKNMHLKYAFIKKYALKIKKYALKIFFFNYIYSKKQKIQVNVAICTNIYIQIIIIQLFYITEVEN